MLGVDGSTPVGILHGRETATTTRYEFEQNIRWFVPKRHRAQLDSPWRYGLVLGKPVHSDQSCVDDAGGGVVRARAIVRLVANVCWDASRVLCVQTYQLTENARNVDKLTSKHGPHCFKKGKHRIQRICGTSR